MAKKKASKKTVKKAVKTVTKPDKTDKTNYGVKNGPEGY